MLITCYKMKCQIIALQKFMKLHSIPDAQKVILLDALTFFAYFISWSASNFVWSDAIYEFLLITNMCNIVWCSCCAISSNISIYIYIYIYISNILILSKREGSFILGFDKYSTSWYQICHIDNAVIKVQERRHIFSEVQTWMYYIVDVNPICSPAIKFNFPLGNESVNWILLDLCLLPLWLWA